MYVPGKYLVPSSAIDHLDDWSKADICSIENLGLQTN